MKVITSNPLIINNKKISRTDMWLALDGNSSVEEKQTFQNWMDLKHPKWVKATNSTLSNGKNLNKGGGYGTFGTSTSKAWKLYGDEFTTSITNLVVNTPTPEIEKALVGTNYSTSDPVTGEKKKGMFFDKVKKLWIKASDSGLLIQLGQILGGLLGLKPTEQPQQTPTWDGKTPEKGTEQTPKKPLSTTAKIIIGVGIVFFIGVIALLISKKSTPAK